jgi:hypothetical protein
LSAAGLWLDGAVEGDQLSGSTFERSAHDGLKSGATENLLAVSSTLGLDQLSLAFLRQFRFLDSSL